MPGLPPIALACLALLVASAPPAMAQQPGYPALRPLDELLAGTGTGRLSPQGGDSLLARAEGLRARARSLRQREVIDAATRARFAAVRARLDS
jgi:hypothetical protein